MRSDLPEEESDISAPLTIYIWAVLLYYYKY